MPFLSYAQFTIRYTGVIFYAKFTCLTIVGSRPGGGVFETNLGRYVPPRFSKVGSLELNFWLETGVVRKKILLKFVSQELKFGQNQQNGLKNAKLFKK